MTHPRILVIGGGLAGLSASMRLAEAGADVDLISLVPVKRSHSVCAQGGINSVNSVTRQQGDSEWMHLDDTIYGGDFLQHQPPVKEMTDWGPRIIDLMDRLGVPFNRTPEGFRGRSRRQCCQCAPEARRHGGHRSRAGVILRRTMAQATHSRRA